MAVGKKSLLFLLLFVFVAVKADAAKRGLLYLGDFHQSVSLRYNYSGAESRSDNGHSTSSSSHGFGETYSAGASYFLLRPRFLNGSIQTGFGLEQRQYSNANSSSRSTGHHLLYDLDGIFFERSTAPLTFFTSSESAEISRPFVPAYESRTAAYGFGVLVNNKIVPMRFDYRWNISETDGLATDRRQSSSRLSISLSNSYKLSATELDFIQSDNDYENLDAASRTDKSSVYSLSGRNKITSPDQRKTLLSVVQYREFEHRDHGRSFNFDESFTWRPGKALTAELSYGQGSTETTRADGTSTDSQTKKGGLALRHRLFRSLNSAIDFRARRTDYDFGRQTEYGANVDLDYVKELPGGKSLNLGYGEGHSISDQDFSTGALTDLQEVLVVTVPGDNLLTNPDVVLSSIEVFDADLPSIRYLSDTETLSPDFRIIQLGDFISLDFDVPGSRVAAGTRVLVTYTQLVDPRLKLKTVRRTGRAALTFRGNYRIFGNITYTDQEVLAGRTDHAGSGPTLSYSVGVSGSIDRVFASLIYANTDSEDTEYEYVEGVLRSQYSVSKGQLHFQARDRYSIYDNTGLGQKRIWRNLFSASASYSRRLFNHGTLAVSSSYHNTKSEEEERNDIFLDMTYRWSLAKLSFETSARTGYRLTDDRTLMDNRLYLRVTRKF